MMWELISKKTKKVNYVDEETYLLLKSRGELSKYNIVGRVAPKKIIPSEIIEKETGETPNKNKHERKREKDT